IGIPAILAVTGSHLADLEKDSFQLLSGLMAGDFLWLMLTLEFLTPLISVGLFRLLIDRRSLLGSEWTLDGYTGEALTGFFLAPALLGLAAIAVLLGGHLEWTD